jgi:hypothetical protein
MQRHCRFAPRRFAAATPTRRRISLAALLCALAACSNEPQQPDVLGSTGGTLGYGGQIEGTDGQFKGSGGQVMGSGGQPGAGGTMAGGGQVGSGGGATGGVAGSGGQLAAGGASAAGGTPGGGSGGVTAAGGMPAGGGTAGSGGTVGSGGTLATGGVAAMAGTSGPAGAANAGGASGSGGDQATVGGNSFHEWLDRAGVEAGPSIDGGAVLPATTAETCNSHNMLKLTSLLFARNPRIEYADYYERTLYNHILATIAPDSGQMTYFTPMHGHFRTYMDGTYCCTGTGIENTPRYNEGIYFQTGDALFINLHIPSEVTWDATGLTIRQEGNAAAGEQVQVTIVEGQPTTATLYLRLPFWSAAPVVTVNGSVQSATPSTYLALSRQWTVGDTVTLTLPASLRLEHAKDVSSMVSVFYGPVLLAGELGSENMPNDFADKDAHLNVAPATVPDIVTNSTNPADWLEATSTTPLAYTAHDAGPATGITFRPLYEVHHQRYSVYWTLQTSN